MNDSSINETSPAPEDEEFQDRRHFLRGMGKWSGAAIFVAIAGTMLSSTSQARAATWINRRCRGRGNWINRGGGGNWINRGGGGWINRSGGGWINRGGASWINRRVGSGGSWINRR
jgi:hypothetical protein